MRNSRLALAFNGVIMMLLGIAFWFFPELFTLAMFPNISDNEQAISVGIASEKIWASAASLLVCYFSGVKQVQKQLHNVSCSVAHSVLV